MLTQALGGSAVAKAAPGLAETHDCERHRHQREATAQKSRFVSPTLSSLLDHPMVFLLRHPARNLGRTEGLVAGMGLGCGVDVRIVRQVFGDRCENPERLLDVIGHHEVPDHPSAPHDAVGRRARNFHRSVQFRRGGPRGLRVGGAPAEARIAVRLPESFMSGA